MHGAFRTALITQWYPPEPTPIPRHITEALIKRGHDVEVLTAMPNYPSGVVHEGYKWWRPVSETGSNHTIRRTPLYASHDGSAVRRMLNYLSWAASTTVFRWRHMRAADAVLVFSSPATAAIPALWARAFFRTPYVIFVQDLWPDSVTAAQFVPEGRVLKVLEKALGWFTDLTYRWASAIAVLSPGMIATLVERGVDQHKLRLIYNWADEAQDPGLPRCEARKRLGLPSEGLILCFAGNHGTVQGLDTIVRAAARLRDLPEVQFAFFGDGVDRLRLQGLADELGCSNVHFMGPRPSSEMPSVMNACDAQLVSLTDHPLFQITMPSKVQGILAAGSPIIAVAAGDVAEVINQSGAGWAVTPGDDEALAGVVRAACDLGVEALSSLGARGANYYQQTMSEKIGGDSLDEMLRCVASTARGK